MGDQQRAELGEAGAGGRAAGACRKRGMGARASLRKLRPVGSGGARGRCHCPQALPVLRYAAAGREGRQRQAAAGAAAAAARPRAVGCRAAAAAPHGGADRVRTSAGKAAKGRTRHVWREPPAPAHPGRACARHCDAIRNREVARRPSELQNASKCRLASPAACMGRASAPACRLGRSILAQFAFARRIRAQASSSSEPAW